MAEIVETELIRRGPPAGLERFVVCMSGYAERGAQPWTNAELPKLIVPLILIFGPGFTLHDADRPGWSRPLARSFTAGICERPVLVGSAGTALCLQVDLTLPGAQRLFGGALSAMAGAVCDLGDLLGRDGDRLAERLAEAGDWPERFDLAAAFLRARLRPPAPRDALAGAAWERIAAARGALRIDALAGELDVSRKHLAGTFRRDFGVAPKTAARILRFERAVAGLAGAASLADLAIDCGYADQAHLNRDFRAFAGETPGTLLARRAVQ